MPRFPYGQWKVVGWGQSVAGIGGPAEVEWRGDAANYHDAMVKAMRSEQWRIYAPVKVVVIQRVPPRPPGLV